MLSRSLYVARTRLREALRYSRTLRSARALLRWAQAQAPLHPATRLDLLCQAYESCEHPPLLPKFADLAQRQIERHQAASLDWSHAPSVSRFARLRDEDSFLSRTVILKTPSPAGEKGVILSTFEYNWFRLVADPVRFQELVNDYHLVLSTSWSPTSYYVLALAAAQAKDTLFVQACNYAEIPKIESFHPRLHCLETLPCDWLNPDGYQAITRDIDIVMVSNWAPFKRHWELFNALRDMPADLRIVCIGQPDSGRTLDDIRALQKQLGAPQQIDFRESISIDEVASLQSRAKVALILSRREGCCVAAAEGLMAGAALAMRYDAHVGPRAYISSETGALLHPTQLARELMTLIKRSGDMRPREFASTRLSCHHSVEKLNSLIREHDLKQGRPWTQDIAMPVWRPHPKIARESDRVKLAPAYQSAHQRWPDLFPADLINTSHT